MCAHRWKCMAFMAPALLLAGCHRVQRPPLNDLAIALEAEAGEGHQIADLAAACELYSEAFDSLAECHVSYLLDGQPVERHVRFRHTGRLSDDPQAWDLWRVEPTSHSHGRVSAP